MNLSHIIIYLILGAAATYLSKIEGRIEVATNSIYLCTLSLPFIVLSAFGAALFFLAFLKFLLLVLIILLALVKNLKFFITKKLGVMIGIATASLLGLMTPPGWVIAILLVLLFIGYLISFTKATLLGIYRFFYRAMTSILMFTRRHSDKIRNALPRILRFTVLIFEVPIICFFSIYSIWHMMNYFESRESGFDLTPEILVTRACAIIPFVVATYLSYRKNTTHPNIGEEMPDVPTIDDIKGAMEFISGTS